MAIEQLYTPDRYSGDGTQTEFPVSFVFHSVSWLRVTLTTGGVDTELANGTDFSGAIASGGVGGSVTLNAAPASGTTITVWMDVPRTQPSVLPSTGYFDLKTLERMLDRATLQIQQIAEAVARAVKTTVSSTTTPDQLLETLVDASADAQSAALSALSAAVQAASSENAAAQSALDAQASAESIAIPLPVASGGTGSITAAGARANLGVYSIAQTDSLFVGASEGVAGVAELATTAEAQAGTDETRIVTPKKLREAFNAPGVAPVYAARAWVAFNGTGSVTMRGNGNVASITDGGTGDYTVNLIIPMPDANYSVVTGVALDDTFDQNLIGVECMQLAVGSFRLRCWGNTSASAYDALRVHAAAFC